eukprot:1725179-Rhodomonas_salina.1
MTDSVVTVGESLCTDTWLPDCAQRLHLSAVVCHQGWLNGPCRHYTVISWISELGFWVSTDDAQMSLLSAAEAFDQAGRL